MMFKLITYNLGQGMRLKEALDFLDFNQADVICLQEVNPQIMEKIEVRLGLKGIYRKMCVLGDGGEIMEVGVGIISKYKIFDEITYYYEREQTEEILRSDTGDRYNLPRVLLGLKLMIGQKLLWVFTTHFTITPDGLPTAHQMNQAVKIKEILRNFDEYILCGDMNMAYQTDTYRILSEGLLDVSRPEIPTLHPTIHRVKNLTHHVDYIFYKSKFLRAEKSSVVMVDGSDHLPVMVDLEIRGGE